MKKQKLRFLKQKPVLFMLGFALVGAAFLIHSFAATPARISDLSTYYPNTSLYKTSYLNGNNYIGGKTAWAVLWFGDTNNATGKYKMYNSNPAGADAKCHWDQFQWTVSSLLYSETRNTCGTDNDITYSPGITYLPRTWNGGSWQRAGDSTAKYYEAGILKCSGTNHWVSQIMAQPVQLAPGVMATQLQNTQTTTWTAGPGSTVTGCKPGQTSRYQENLYFVSDLPIYGGKKVAPGLKRSVGGSLDFYAQHGWDWDIWFDNWKSL